jgi:hypothetical protein
MSQMKLQAHRVITFVLLLLTGNCLTAQDQLTNLPALYITTDDGRDPYSKDIYQTGRIRVKSAVPGEELDTVTEIRGRGNSTWDLAKKPYRIKLDKKISLLNLPAKAKSWVLLANHADKSLIRNALAFKISELAGLGFTPSVRFVDLVLNGNYAGNYMLTDQIEVNNNRVPVEEQKAGTAALPDLSGGYLLEIDGFATSETHRFSTNRNMLASIKYPDGDEINSAQIQYIKNFTQQFEDALFSSNFTDPVSGYRALVDENSLINWYIASELSGNPDAFWSTYIYKYRGIDKFYFGPLWDYDIAFNNDDRLGNAVRKLMREEAHEPKTWIRRLWEDNRFRKAVNDRWQELVAEGMTETLTAYIRQLEAELNESQQLNFQKWNILNRKIFREVFLFPTYKDEIDYLVQYIEERAAFLTEQFAAELPLDPSVPFVAENYYYTIQNKKTGNQIKVENASRETGAKLELWNPLEDDYSQQWSFIPLEEDKYMIINRLSQLAAAGNGYSQNLIQAAPDTDDPRQQWRVIPVLSGNRYGLVNEGSTYSVNNSGGQSANGTPAIEYTARISESENQQWFIEKTASMTTAVKEEKNTLPMMGWSSWNANRININENLIKETADSIISLGLKDAGYTWVNTDDGFFGGRNADGHLQVNAKFPGGMKAIADYIHDKGLNAGIYSEIGRNTCAYTWDNDKINGKDAGLYGHEEQDLKLFFEDWGFNFIKVDYCGGQAQNLDEKTSYTNVANIIQTIEAETGKDIRYNVCRWIFPGAWVTEIADSWRIHDDIHDSFSSIKTIIEKNTWLAAYASSGHYNDMDMLQVGRGLTVAEEKTHFGMWCIMSSPIMIGCNLKGIRQSTLDIIKNTEIIALNQDTLGLQAQLIDKKGNCMVFAKPVEIPHGKIRAVALFNGEDVPKTIRVTFKDIQLSEKARVRNLWTHTDLGEYTAYYETTVPAHETAMLRIEGEASLDKTRFQGEYAFMNAYSAIPSTGNIYARVESVTGLSSGGHKMSKLGRFASNWAEFRDVYSSAGGKYTFKLFYYSPENRNLSVIVNGTEYRMENLNSGDIHTRAEASIEIELNQGNNVIRLANSSAWAPDVDKFELIAEGAEEEKDNFEINDVSARFPEISSEDNSSEKWYFIQFKNGNGVIQDMGENTSLLTKTIDENEEAQHWKVVAIANPSGEFKYRIKNKSGRSITHVTSPETADGLFQTTNDPDAASVFRIVETTNSNFIPAWELDRQGSNNRHVNQFGAAGIGRKISEWTANDQGNPLLFVALPPRSTAVKGVQSFPPAKITVSGKNLSVEGKNIISVHLYSLTGQLLNKKTGDSPVFTQPQPGCYLVSIRYENRIETKKIVL